MLFLQLSFPTKSEPVFFTSFYFLLCEQAESHFSNSVVCLLETCLYTTSGGIDMWCVPGLTSSHAMTVGYLCVPPGQNCPCFILKVLRVCQMVPLNLASWKKPHPWAWKYGLDIQSGPVSAS